VKLVSKYGCQNATRCSNLLHMHLGSSGELTSLKMLWNYANTRAQSDTLDGWHIWARVEKLVKWRRWLSLFYSDRALNTSWPDTEVESPVNYKSVDALGLGRFSDRRNIVNVTRCAGPVSGHRWCTLTSATKLGAQRRRTDRTLGWVRYGAIDASGRWNSSLDALWKWSDTGLPQALAHPVLRYLCERMCELTEH
jgi:hypothetical protein